MASYSVPIATAVQSIVAALPNAPALVEVRKADVLHPRELTTAFCAVIITIGRTRQVGATFWGTSGFVQKTYEIACSVYGSNFGNMGSDMATHPDFVLAVKQALNTATLAGAPSVYDCDLEENDEWERQAFQDSSEVSRFGFLYYSNEPRNG